MRTSELDLLTAWIRDTDARQFRVMLRSCAIMALAILVLTPVLDRFRGDPFDAGTGGWERFARLTAPLLAVSAFAPFLWGALVSSRGDDRVRRRLTELLCGLTTRDLIERTFGEERSMRRLGTHILWARAAHRRDQMAERFLRGEVWTDQPEGQAWSFASFSAAVEEHARGKPDLKLVAIAPLGIIGLAFLVPVALAAFQMPLWLAVIDGREPYRPSPTWLGVVAQVSVYGGMGVAFIVMLYLQWKMTPRNKRGKRPTTDELLDLWLKGDWGVWQELRLRSRPKKLKDPLLEALRERLPLGREDPDIRWKDVWPLYRRSDRPPVVDVPPSTIDW